MNTSHHLAAAEAILAAVDRGDYDEQLGIPAEDRALLIKATTDEPLTLDDLAGLARLNRPDVIDAAHRAGRITLNDQENDR